MITCKYCGQALDFIGEFEAETYFNCSFCKIVFPFSETSVDRKRKNSVPSFYENNYYVPTKELLKRNTISLYYVLKDIRSAWYQLRISLDNLKKALKETDKETDKKSIEELMNELNDEFIDLSKRRCSVENIILERTGFFPEKITEQFLCELIEQGIKASQKPMNFK
ncbi:hypothetical protein [Bacillus safensis]|uniref:hypothetical protein n=1 Tax=Bacillus safensis TaxID=561879 RepID=UPI002E207071|nr:hypothetical protein [Bacillus safensis]